MGTAMCFISLLTSWGSSIHSFTAIYQRAPLDDFGSPSPHSRRCSHTSRYRRGRPARRWLRVRKRVHTHRLFLLLKMCVKGCWGIQTTNVPTILFQATRTVAFWGRYYYRAHVAHEKTGSEGVSGWAMHTWFMDVISDLTLRQPDSKSNLSYTHCILHYPQSWAITGHRHANVCFFFFFE